MQQVQAEVAVGTITMSSELSEPMARHAELCQLSGAGLSDWQWLGRKCKQTGGVEAHERGGHALGLDSRQSDVDGTQAGLS
jgi:hypothetical protein